MVMYRFCYIVQNHSYTMSWKCVITTFIFSPVVSINSFVFYVYEILGVKVRVYIWNIFTNTYTCGVSLRFYKCHHNKFLSIFPFVRFTVICLLKFFTLWCVVVFGYSITIYVVVPGKNVYFITYLFRSVFIHYYILVKKF